MPEPIDAYKVLQVDAEAEDEVIQAAYRRLARKYHPDLAAGSEAAARMAAINAAWDLIGEPAAREAYDRARLGAARPTSTSAPASAPGAPPASAPGAASGASASGAPPSRPPVQRERPPETVSRDWTSGRSTQGGGYDESMRAPEGFGAAGPPPGRPSGSVLTFGRYAGWSLGEIARHDLEFLEWLDRMPIGRSYREEIDNILRAAGRRRSAEAESTDRRGLFRRR
jgi:curved DNA-binding protein CbpA